MGNEISNIKRIELYSMLCSPIGTYEDILKKIDAAIKFINDKAFAIMDKFLLSEEYPDVFSLELTQLQLQTAINILTSESTEKIYFPSLIFYDSFVESIQSNKSSILSEAELIFYLSLLKVLKSDAEKIISCESIKPTDFPAIKINYKPSKDDGFFL